MARSNLRTETARIPVINIDQFSRGDRDAKRTISREVDESCSEIGFILIERHGVPRDLAEEVLAVSRQFFELPIEEKMRIAQPSPDIMRGYAAPGHETLSYGLDKAAPPDLNESFQIGPLYLGSGSYYRGRLARMYFTPNLWPVKPKGFKQAWCRYYQAMEGLSQAIMRMFAAALGLSEGYFEPKIDRHISRLRIRHYLKQSKAPLSGQLRAGAHTDYGSLTILLPENDQATGLQVFSKDGSWCDVPLVSGTYIINIGDLLARWTNDRWTSTLHRVVNPPGELVAKRDRLSLPFFHAPNYDTVVRCLNVCRNDERLVKYPPVTTAEHLRMKFLRTNVPSEAAKKRTEKR